MWGLATLSCQKTAQRGQALREAGGREAAVGRSLLALKGLRVLPAVLLSLSPGDKSSSHRHWIHGVYFLKVGLLSLMRHSGPFPSPLLQEN